LTSQDRRDSHRAGQTQQIRNQFTIAYALTNQALDGRYRSIRVTVSGNARLTVRTRSGYIAGRPCIAAAACRYKPNLRALHGYRTQRHREFVACRWPCVSDDREAR
jgi:hypothetical protein